MPQNRLDTLFLITKGTWGGAQRYVYDLAQGAKASGKDILVVYGMPGELDRKLEAAGIRRSVIPSFTRDISLFKEWDAFRHLLGILKKYRPAVLHTNSSKAGLLGALAGRMTRVPRIIFTAHGWAFNEDRPWWQRVCLKLLHISTVLLSHTTICVSDAVARDMPRFLQKRLVVIKHGITCEVLLPQKEARTRLSTNTASTWIGMIAELHPTKRVDAAIDAFAAIASTQEDVALVIIGEGSERGRLEARIEKHGLAGKVVLAGFVPNAAQYVNAFDVFLLISRTEALGYVLLEAGCAARMVIGSKVGGIPEIIRDEETGLLVDPNDHTSLTDALERALQDQTLRQTLGAALKEEVATSFTLEKMRQATDACYLPIR